MEVTFSYWMVNVISSLLFINMHILLEEVFLFNNKSMKQSSEAISCMK